MRKADRGHQSREGQWRSGHAAGDCRRPARLHPAAKLAALDFGEEREIAQLRRLWESIELEILRVLEAGNALRESPDYVLHRLTTQSPAFFDETVRRHVESLEKELAELESEAEELAREIAELTGEVVPGIG